MRKGMKAFVKIGTAVMMSTCIAFSNVNASILVNAEENQGEYAFYEDDTEVIEETKIEEFTESIEESTESEQTETEQTETETETEETEQTETETEEAETEETTEPEVATLELEDEYPIAIQSNSVYTIGGTEYNIAEAIEYSNDYGTGYYFEDSKTLLVTSAGTATTSDNKEYPWYEINENIEKAIITSDAGSIGNFEFSGYGSLKNVIIEEGVTTIGASAFMNCSLLQELIIPEGVTKIEERTFAGCSSLNHLVMPLSVTSIDGYYTFSGCNSLISASPISENKGTGYEYGWTETIPANAFKDLDKLQTVSILDTITTIGIRVFMSCSSLQEVIIPEGVTKIEERTFVDCSSLNHLVMPASVTEISDWYTFSGCSSLTTASPISEGRGTGYEYGWTETIPAFAFTDLNKIQEISLIDTIRSIGKSAFRGCSSLQELIIPDGVTKIEERTFADCSSLRHLVIPLSINDISDWYTFDNCTSLISVSPLSENRGTGYEYGWTEAIPAYAFKSLNKVQSASIKDTINNIGKYAFGDMESLVEIDIPESVNSIEYRAFTGCNNLTTFRIGNGIENIGSNAFSLNSSTDTTVITDNKVVKAYNWSGDNRNVTFERLTPITDLDISIPVNSMSFNIDSDKNFSSEAVKIVNNSPCDIGIYVKNINGGDNAVDIVPESNYTDTEWDALTEFNSIAFTLNSIDLAEAYNNSANDESKFISLGKIGSAEDELDASDYTFTTYSVATAKANGRASISSGKAGYVGNGADNYIYWTIDVEKSGTYCLGVNGAVSGTRTTYIDANGVNVGSVTHKGSSWSTGFDVYTTVDLQAGENIIKLYNNSDYAPDIYNLQLSNEFVLGNTFDLQLEAKYPKSYDIDSDLEMNYNLTFLFVSQEN